MAQALRCVWPRASRRLVGTGQRCVVSGAATAWSAPTGSNCPLPTPHSRPGVTLTRIHPDTKGKFGPSSWNGAVPWERSSLLLPEALADEDVDDFIREEIECFAPMRPRPLSMQEVLDMLEPRRIAKYLHVEVPVRYAERIRWIEEIPGWEEVEELARVHAVHVKVFKELRLVQRQPDLEAFTTAVQHAVEAQKEVRLELAKAMHRLHVERGDDYGSAFADSWLDKVLLNCIGTETLMSQYLACVRLEANNAGGARPRTLTAGIIDPDCDVAHICREVAADVQAICEEQTGRSPVIRIEVFQDRGVARFSYIPGFLRFILTEVFKNSCRATVELAKTDREVQKRPINVIVCADEHDVAIRVSDRARGIPFEVGSRVWSYLYTTANKTRNYAENASSLAGYGVGLPLSRLYARYLGGSLNLVSLPGYGTSVDLFLTRVSADQVELVPDSDS